MLDKITKRDGETVPFDPSKIEAAIGAAWIDAYGDLDEADVEKVGALMADVCYRLALRFQGPRIPGVEDVQDAAERALIEAGYGEVAAKYIRWRCEHEAARNAKRDAAILGIIEATNEEAKGENSNKNPDIASTQRDYMAGEVSKDISKRYLLPKDVVEAHEDGRIHFHDMDYFAQHISNCCLVNLDDMLQNGTVITDTLIEKPHSFSTACNIATQIIAQVASSQYGGQSISLTHLAPFVDVTREKLRKRFDGIRDLFTEGHTFDEFIEDAVREDIRRGVQTIQYQILTLMTTNGQTPFVTVYMDLTEARNEQEKTDLAHIIEEVLRQRIDGVKNADGVAITPAFPKLIYTLDDCNMGEGAPFRYLTELAAKCTAKRMVPDYISAKKMRELKLSKGEEVGHGDVYPCMGCRSFLTPDRSGNGYGNVSNAGNYEAGKPKYYGRFNQGVVTINLPDVALSSNGIEDFWNILDDRLELCHKALRARHERLLGTVSDIAPIFWQHGAVARLKPGETIDRLLYGGYSTISLGYAGLYECTLAMTGCSHTEQNGRDFALSVMQRLNDKCAEWKAAENIDYSVYGTPLESTTEKFAKALQGRFGIIPGITDHGYITNSYHVNVREEIDAFTKLGFEAPFQELSPGGAISYVEVPDMQGNIPAVLALLDYIYENIMYAELNCKSDYCGVCGFDGEISVEESDDGRLRWRCPRCGNMDEHTLSVVRRTCGYLGSQFWNQGRTEEIKDRVLHL